MTIKKTEPARAPVAQVAASGVKLGLADAEGAEKLQKLARATLEYRTQLADLGFPEADGYSAAQSAPGFRDLPVNSRGLFAMIYQEMLRNASNALGDVAPKSPDPTQLRTGNAPESVPYQLKSAKIEGDELVVQVNYAAGFNKKHDFEAYWDGQFTAGLPWETELKILHASDGEDPGERLGEQPARFDLSKIKNDFRAFFPEQGDSIGLRVGDKTLTYSF
jgi:hypothetical protein